MSEEKSVFSFELNESLYFDKGQEVAEMRGISLEPEITIQPYNDYISIRGVIELQGQYEALEGMEEETITDFEAFEAKRYMEKVEVNEEGFVTFSHRFPVEISVPTYRVSDLNAVTVSVESFDYELPEEGQLKLYSTISIYGIDQDVKEPRLQDVEENTVEEIVDTEEEIEEREEEIAEETHAEEFRKEDSFEFELKFPQEGSSHEEDIHSLSTTPSLSPEAETTQEDDNEEEDETGRWLFKTKSQSLQEFFGHTQEVEENETEDNNDYEMDDELEEDDEVDEEERSPQDVSYLADIFRNSEQEGFTKMRLCIVQKEDTLESIAERFQVSALSLIKQNKLEDDFDVTEGQLLYIPQKTS
ncbi:stage VI sporulation protein D [Oceanobacillus piezotolerans]|uniref:Stage VI sporulation protein D n=1 Tax=Oceanobacillus piezotolerans TaxID=2448030 RepID=A0A498DA12_9BACI|nr:stage VI sporulation protein D [Oceanobacillus piezotolerans]RLL47954.1 stage VI sporulation protein D [Oceanobacillus piezotolerans]